MRRRARLLLVCATIAGATAASAPQAAAPGPSLCAGDDFVDGGELDDVLEVSLLQTSLRLSHEQASPVQAGQEAPRQDLGGAAAAAASAAAGPGEGLAGGGAASAAAAREPPQGEVPPTPRELPQSAPPDARWGARWWEAPHSAHAAPVALSSFASRALAMAYDPEHGLVEGVPMMLICMLAFIIGLVFVIQVVGFSLEGRDVDDLVKPPPHAGRLAYGGPGLYRYDKFGSDQRYSGGGGAYGVPSGAFLPVPSARESLDRGSFTAYSQSQSAVGTQRASSSTAGADPADKGGNADAICPALILPHGEAQFSIPADSIRKLGQGQYPVEILGPSGRPLLHARLPSQPIGGSVLGGGSGRWLELTTTPTSRYPHACVGPIPLGSSSSWQPLEIRGPRGDAYGTLEPSGQGGWCAQHGGRIVLRIEYASQGGLHAFAPDQGVIATASPNGGQTLRVQVNPGVDALLTLLCMLAVVLMSPESTGLRA